MIGQEGYTRFLAKITYTHQAADQSHLSEAYCTRLHPYTIFSRRHEASEKHKGASAFITHRCYARAHHPEVCRTENYMSRDLATLFAFNPYMKGVLIARAELLELPS